MKSRIILGLLLICAVSLHLGGQAAGEKPYPNKGVNIFVPFNPGGGTDVSARLFGTYLAKKWRVPINVINKPGAGGIIGTHEALSAKPDGYTVLCVAHNITITPAFATQKLPFDWRNETFMYRATIDPLLYIVRPDAPWKNLKELAEFIRKNPKKVRWGASGKSGISYLAGAQFLSASKITLDGVNQVAFTGGAPVVAALAGSHIDLGAQQLSEVYGMIKGKKIRALGVVGEKRLEELPEVPTTAEQGYAMLDTFGWHGISGPAGISEDIVAKWVKTMEAGSKDPMFVKMAGAVFKKPGFLAGKEFKDFLERQYKKQLGLAKSLGVKK
jgi:tripartite-type tricarboxylate transporter receptor subunit TctC